MIPAGFPADSCSRRWRVAVLLGGNSAEREISLKSGAAIAAALQQAGHVVACLDPDRQSLTDFPWSTVDLAFIALHGTYGEDGGIQRQLDDLHVCYTGSDATASSLAFHKWAAKERFLEDNLPTPKFRVVSPEMDSAAIHQAARELGVPLIVKPEAQGSSLGVSILNSEEALLPAIDIARSLGNLVLLEQAIPGQEWTVPVLDQVVFPPIRIGTPHQFFDFDAKYRDEQTCYDVITNDEDPVAAQVQALALSACRSLGCRGINRVDLRVDPSGQAWLLEVNTIPGMTDHSLVPKSARAWGWSMAQLCEEIIRSAWSLRRTDGE